MILLSLWSSADTKRKVEQISEELRSLDEMLAAKQDADEMEAATGDTLLPAPPGDSNSEGTSRR